MSTALGFVSIPDRSPGYLVNGMEWAKPEYSKNKVDRAGKMLLKASTLNWNDYELALQVINNWRASHYYPLNTFKVTLRRKSLDVDSDRLVAQRIKRLSSIEAKLVIYTTSR